ncbi:MAG: pantoate--beta-alanine ligase [Gaiellaceae bacterium]
MKTLRTAVEVRGALEPFRAGSTVALVPTMGAYHDGHLSLFRAARAEANVVVASLFVNPAQFGPAEDFAEYPRDERRDGGLAADAGVDFLFAPTAAELYPPGFQTWVEVEEISRTLEGAHRPGHFRGVATVCLQLFNIVRPQLAYFGLKDAQQAAVVQQLVRDLHLELRVRVLPTVRDADGLALSSRNVHLSPAERQTALALPRALAAGAEAALRGADPVAAAHAALNGLTPDYVATLEVDGRRVLAAAVRVGRTRLIDNVPLEGAPT